MIRSAKLLTPDTIAVQVEASAKTHAAMCGVPGAWYNPATMRWIVPLASWRELSAALGLVRVSAELRAALNQELQKG